MRPKRRRLLAAAAAAFLASTPPAASALAQGAAAQAPAFSADQITDILKPPSPEDGGGGETGGMPMPRTRGLKAGGGPEGGAVSAAPAPGLSGSGVLPDLKIPFGYGSDELTPEARAQLDQLAKAIGREELRGFRFMISGHTDVVGGDAYNEGLSERRAVAVVSYLARNHGVPAERLAAAGYGEKQLADPADPTSGRNRRVEVRTLGEKP